MFTNEFLFDATIITIMDDTGEEEDVSIEITDKFVDIRQFNPDLGKYDLITMSPKMMAELLESFNHPEGLFQTEFQDNRRK